LRYHGSKQQVVDMLYFNPH